MSYTRHCSMNSFVSKPLSANGDLPSFWVIFHEHDESVVAFRRAVRLADTQVDEQAVAVLHERVRGEAELGLLALSLARKSSFGVGRRFVGLVRALLSVE